MIEATACSMRSFLNRDPGCLYRTRIRFFDFPIVAAGGTVTAPYGPGVSGRMRPTWRIRLLDWLRQRGDFCGLAPRSGVRSVRAGALDLGAERICIRVYRRGAPLCRSPRPLAAAEPPAR